MRLYNCLAWAKCLRAFRTFLAETVLSTRFVFKSTSKTNENLFHLFNPEKSAAPRFNIGQAIYYSVLLSLPFPPTITFAGNHTVCLECTYYATALCAQVGKLVIRCLLFSILKLSWQEWREPENLVRVCFNMWRQLRQCELYESRPKGRCSTENRTTNENWKTAPYAERMT